MEIKTRKVWRKLGGWLGRWPFVWYGLPPLAWMLVIFVLSAQPTLPQAPDAFWDVALKKAAHMAEYAILMLLLWRALNARPRPVAPLALAFALTLLYAASDEFHQTFVPGRQGRVWDVLIDGLGAACAALGIWKVRQRQRS